MFKLNYIIFYSFLSFYFLVNYNFFKIINKNLLKISSFVFVMFKKQKLIKSKCKNIFYKSEPSLLIKGSNEFSSENPIKNNEYHKEKGRIKIREK